MPRLMFELYSRIKTRHACLLPYPTDLNVELTTRCNTDCSYCPRKALVQTQVRRVGDMPMELVRRVATEFATLPGTRHAISPDGLGEPSLYPRLRAALQALRVQCPTAILHANTNCINPLDVFGDGVLDQLILSVNTWRPADRVLENARQFLTSKPFGGTRAMVQILDTDENRAHIGEFRSMWEPYLREDDCVYVRRVNDFGGRIDVSQYVKDHQVPNRYPCPSLFRTVMVDIDGYVYPCCMGVSHGPQSDLCIGNIKDQSLATLLQSPDLSDLKRRHMAGEYPDPCANCQCWSATPNPFVKWRGVWR